MTSLSLVPQPKGDDTTVPFPPAQTPSASSRDFEAWLLYADEKSRVEDEAAFHEKRLGELRRRWWELDAAQGALGDSEGRAPA